MDEILKKLAGRLRIPGAEVITADEMADWPEGKLAELVEMGILTEIQHARGVKCLECDENCFMEPVYIMTHPETGKTVGVYGCHFKEDIGRIEFDVERMRQWKINAERLNALGYAKKTATHTRKNQKQNEKLLIISALLEYHGFWLDDEVEPEPLKQKKLAKLLGWNQSKVSRVLKRNFPEGFWGKYLGACKNNAIRGFLANLDDAKTDPEGIDYRPLHPTDKEEKSARKYE